MMIDDDVTILGAGPVGSTLALLLARLAPEPHRIRLCRREAPAQPADADARAPAARALALNHGSRTLLEQLGAWPEGGATIHTIHVSQRGRLGRTLIEDQDFQVPELGTVHHYDQLSAALDKELAASGITLQSGPPAGLVHEEPDHLQLVQGSHLWRSRLVIQAEGSPADTDAGVRQRQYDQDAILTTVRAASPRAGWAWERFTREGPLALLPIHLAGNSPQETHYAVVWCCRPGQAEALLTADDATFAQQLNTTFGRRLGWLTPVAKRSRQALTLRWRAQVTEPRRVVIGNAAQSLHPVAGQGLNLGLRDAAQLAQILTPWLARAHQDPAGPLRRFSERRRPDRLLTLAVTDLLPRVFTTGWPPIEHLCGLGLLALDTLPPLRRPLAQHLMLGLRR